MIAVANQIITCPVCDDPYARLSIWPHPQAGIWDCDDCGASGECDHSSTHSETVTVDTFNGEHGQYETEVDVCNECGSTLEDNDEIIKGDCGA